MSLLILVIGCGPNEDPFYEYEREYETYQIEFRKWIQDFQLIENSVFQQQCGRYRIGSEDYEGCREWFYMPAEYGGWWERNMDNYIPDTPDPPRTPPGYKVWDKAKYK